MGRPWEFGLLAGFPGRCPGAGGGLPSCYPVRFGHREGLREGRTGLGIGILFAGYPPIRHSGGIPLGNLLNFPYFICGPRLHRRLHNRRLPRASVCHPSQWKTRHGLGLAVPASVSPECMRRRYVTHLRPKAEVPVSPAVGALWQVCRLPSSWRSTRMQAGRAPFARRALPPKPGQYSVRRPRSGAHGAGNCLDRAGRPIPLRKPA